jgi:UDP-N-acetylmuramate dehydrogenase
MDKIFEELNRLLPDVKKNVELKNYSTFRIGGLAKYFFIAQNEIELKIAIQKALDLKINFVILGGGSNTLISSQGFDGLAIVYKNSRTMDDFLPVELNGEFFVEASADWPLHFLVEQASICGLSGMEWAVGIPGTVGGAVNGNAGAFGVEIGDMVLGVQVLEIKNSYIAEKFFSPEECEFEYRQSIFKLNPKLIILSARIRFRKDDATKIKKQISDHIAHRQGKHPNGFSIGSIFKNYIGEVREDVLNKYPELLKQADKGSISAGYLIEQCGLKGREINDAKISEEHANFIVNLGNATSEDVLAMICLIENEVKAKFGIELEKEIKVI